MPDSFPAHPLTGQHSFRNPRKVSVATWEIIGRFSSLARISGSLGEVQWLEAAWREVEKTTWAQYSDDFEWHRVILRFLSLVEFVHIYCHLADIESFEREYKYFEWVDECDLSRVKLAVMCGENFLEDRFVDVENNAPYETTDELLDQEYPRIIELVADSLGGPDAMLQSLYMAIEANNLSNISADSDESTEGFWRFEGTVEGHNITQWRDEEFPRSGLDGYL